MVIVGVTIALKVKMVIIGVTKALKNALEVKW